MLAYDYWNVLPTESQFAGESFELDLDANLSPSSIRTVYVGASSDNCIRNSRTIILIGEENCPESVSSIVDFMCNIFYGIEYNFNYRLRIANERFDKTTPKKPVTKYVFNETIMSFRPVIITVFFQPSLYFHKNVSELLSTVMPSNTEFHSISFVLSAKQEKTISDQEHTVSFQLPESLLQKPRRRSTRGSLVLLLNYSQLWIDGMEPRLLLTSSSGQQFSSVSSSSNLNKFTTFQTNTRDLFSKPSADPLKRYLQQNNWMLTLESFKRYFELVRSLKLQVLKELMESEEKIIATNLPTSCDSAISSSETSLTLSQEIGYPHTPTRNVSGDVFCKSLDYNPVIPPVLGPEHAEQFMAEGQAVAVIPKNQPKILKLQEDSRMKLASFVCEEDSRYTVKEIELTKSATNEASIDLTQFSDTNQIQVVNEYNDWDVFRRYVYDPNTLSYKVRFLQEVKLWKDSYYASSTNDLLLKASRSLSDLGISINIGAKGSSELQDYKLSRRESHNPLNSLRNKLSSQELTTSATTNQEINSYAFLPDAILTLPKHVSNSRRPRFGNPPSPTTNQVVARRSFERHSTSRKFYPLSTSKKPRDVTLALQKTITEAAVNKEKKTGPTKLSSSRFLAQQ